jgi:hypothetical protein
MPLTETGSEWLPLADCLTWLNVSSGTTKADHVELARRAAGEWIEDQRPDLAVAAVLDPPVDGYYDAGPRIVQAGILATARLFSRQGSPSGLVSYGEFAASVLRDDPDVRGLLGRPRPRVG